MLDSNGAEVALEPRATAVPLEGGTASSKAAAREQCPGPGVRWTDSVLASGGLKSRRTAAPAPKSGAGGTRFAHSPAWNGAQKRARPGAFESCGRERGRAGHETIPHLASGHPSGVNATPSSTETDVGGAALGSPGSGAQEDALHLVAEPRAEAGTGGGLRRKTSRAIWAADGTRGFGHGFFIFGMGSILFFIHFARGFERRSTSVAREAVDHQSIGGRPAVDGG